MESCCRQSSMITCDKLVVDCQSLEVLSTYVTNVSSLSRSERPPCRAKLITRFNNRPIVEKFSKSRVCGKVPEGCTLIFGGTQISSQQGKEQPERSSPDKNQLNSFSRFSKTSTCDRQRQTRGHRWYPQ